VLEFVLERSRYGSALTEGFNNLCFGLQAMKDILDLPYFAGKTLTAVGKTEWADIKWNDQSIADKKTIINGAHVIYDQGDLWGKVVPARPGCL
jgi:hypothetical protein